MRRPRTACLAVLAAAAALAACTAPVTTPGGPSAGVAEPLPAAAVVAGSDACPARLAFAQRCTATVQAQAWQSKTGIQVQPGEAYCLQAVPGQVWVDWYRRHTPPHGDAGNWMMRRVDHWRRHPDSAWFALMAAVQPADAGGKAQHQDLSRSGWLRPTQAGALLLYPNDAVSPVGNPQWFYENNHGQVQVTVWRCDGACACPASPPG